jgi:hypothetical protein
LIKKNYQGSEPCPGLFIGGRFPPLGLLTGSDVGLGDEGNEGGFGFGGFD